MRSIVIILSKRRRIVWTTIEKPEGWTFGQVAHAWAKGEGYESFPTDCEYVGCYLTSFSSVLQKIMPTDIIAQIRKEGANHANS